MFELDDEEYADSDIPTTLIRSKADCPTMEVSGCGFHEMVIFNVRACVCMCVCVQVTTLSTNDIVINKLTQILSYLRQGVRSGKKGKTKEK